MSNYDGFSYLQTFLSIGIEQGLQKLPKFDINDLRFLFHCNILIPRKCLLKPYSKCPPPFLIASVFYEQPLAAMYSRIPCNIFLIVTAMKGQKNINVHQNATNKPLEELILRKNKQHENLKKGQSTKDLALR